jgi:UDP-N-acetylmuramoyl-L-alanyl-D-glutamate--2,6-diaminopimelate ligase
VIVEVSSQGIKQGRIGNLIFDLCIFTGISTDHIGEGEHESFEEYKKYKLTLFDERRCRCALFDERDACTTDIVKRCGKYVTIYGKNKESITPEHVISRYGSSVFSIEDTVFSISMPGEFNVKNATLALRAAAYLTSLPINTFAEKLKKIKVSGRYEVYEISGKTVIIDYAHNEESLREVLLEVRRKTLGKVIILYGSVGGRVKSRRKALAMTAEQYADYSYITSDNPGEENVAEICSEIASYYVGGGYRIIQDRLTAILFAIQNMSSLDTLVLAGKGHEGYQLINGEKVPFSEKEIIYSVGGKRVN